MVLTRLVTWQFEKGSVTLCSTDSFVIQDVVGCCLPRIVGYDEVPFDERSESGDQQFTPDEMLHEDFRRKSLLSDQEDMFARQEFRKKVGRGRGYGASQVATRYVATRYIAPFDDPRIESFARNWYMQREAAATRAGEDASHLVRAVHADNAILRLARTPNLLTMMALIHRVEATLHTGVRCYTIALPRHIWSPSTGFGCVFGSL